jgi:hypothetical protein
MGQKTIRWCAICGEFLDIHQRNPVIKIEYVATRKQITYMVAPQLNEYNYVIEEVHKECLPALSILFPYKDGPKAKTIELT